MSHITKKFKLTEATDMDCPQSECFKQGAESRIFKTNYLGRSVLVKERFSKKYRHPELDRVLTKERITSEIRGLMKCRVAGIRTPAVYAVNSLKNQIIMEIIDGKTVKDLLLVLELNVKESGDCENDENDMSVDEDSADDEETSSVLNGKTKNANSSKTKPVPPPIINNLEVVHLDQNDEHKAQTILSNLISPLPIDSSNETDTSKEEIRNNVLNLSQEDITNTLKLLSIQIGSTLSVMHMSNIIHGDLTTSNMIINKDNHLVMIDFGLSQIKVSNEDKAVDLYVLKRAILSLHSIFARNMFDWILASYRKANRKQFETVMKTFAEVELRGRKRCMVG